MSQAALISTDHAFDLLEQLYVLKLHVGGEVLNVAVHFGYDRLQKNFPPGIRVT
jgi:hypothetical protein